MRTMRSTCDFTINKYNNESLKSKFDNNLLLIFDGYICFTK